MGRWAWVLLPVGILGYLLQFFHISEGLLFVLTGLGIIPLAAIIGKATEDLAYRVGAAGGGLLNVTFGNVPELLIGGLALRDGLVGLTQATIVGSVIGNASLVVGMSLFWGGVRHGTQRFDRQHVGHHAVMMILAVASLSLPSLFAAAQPNANVEALSVFVAVLLVVSYAAYLAYDIGGLRGGRWTGAEDTFLGESERVVEELVEQEGGPDWSWRRALFWLAASTVLVGLEADVLVGAVRPVTQAWGISEFFVGLVIVPIIGNVAEHFSAVLLAGKNKMDLSFAVASGSAIQVALFVAPVLVLISFLWHPMTLVFNPIEIAVLALVTGIFFFVCQDGESNWLEGLQLILLYVMAGAVFYFLPIQGGL